MTRSTRLLRVGKATLNRWYKTLGIATNPERNGVALRGTGTRSRPKVGRHLWAMRVRVRRCLDKHPPKPKTATHGMSPTERWMWRYRNIPGNKIVHLLRKRIRNTVKRGDKSATTLELLGCTREHLMAHLRSYFTKGMHWNNLGVGRGKWNIEHVIPCASFDLTRPDQQRICFHWTNLRPMWAIPNIKKGARVSATPCLPF